MGKKTWKRSGRKEIRNEKGERKVEKRALYHLAIPTHIREFKGRKRTKKEIRNEKGGKKRR